MGRKREKIKGEKDESSRRRIKKIKIKCGWKRMKRREKEGQEKSRRAIECLNEDIIK